MLFCFVLQHLIYKYLDVKDQAQANQSVTSNAKTREQKLASFKTVLECQRSAMT